MFHVGPGAAYQGSSNLQVNTGIVAAAMSYDSSRIARAGSNNAEELEPNGPRNTS